MLWGVVARTVWKGKGSTSTLFPPLGRETRPGRDIVSKLWRENCTEGGLRGFHVGLASCKGEGRKEMLASLPKRDEGTEDTVSVDLDSTIRGSDASFPDENTPDMLFDGVRFADLPIVHAKISKNNTLLTLSDAQGKAYTYRSCGLEGFKNARKGTNIAAQATGISLAVRAIDKGVKNVRVKVKGLGPGRISAVKGLTMGGLNVVSITDDTPIMLTNAQRPRKARKL